jgi:hypothetical protein
MNINYNKSNKSIEIKDALKIISFQLADGVKSGECDSKFIRCKASFGFMKIIWLILGTISIVILYNSILKTGMDKIPIDQIKGLNQRVLGRKKYFIELKNGKTRDLLK